MRHHLVAVALAACGAACAAPPIERPFVPALRYSQDPAPRALSEDAPFRATPEARAPEAPPRRPAIQSFTLDNGVRVVVVERHEYPMIAAEMVIEAPSVFVGDVGGRRAQLLAHVFLATGEGSRETKAACGPVGCTVAARGAAGDLGEMVGRLGDLVTRAGETEEVYARRLKTLEDGMAGSRRDAWAAFRRNARALAFGNRHRYGDSSDGARPTLSEIQALRERAFLPRAATLVVVGDVTPDEVKAEAAQRLGGWQGGPPVEGKADSPPAAMSPSRIVMFPSPIRQILGAIVARGPAPSDQDAPAFQLLVELLGGTPSAMAFRQAREDLGATYSIGAFLDWYPDASMMTLGGSFERDSAIDAMRALLTAIGSLRSAGPSDEALERAKRAATARWRRSNATVEGVAALLAEAVLEGLPPESAQARLATVEAVTAAQVHAAADRYLSRLRVALVGDPEFLVDANRLGLGTPTRTDGFGLPVP